MADPRKLYSTKLTQETIDALTECCGKKRSRAVEFAINVLVTIMNDDPRAKQLIMSLANSNNYPEAGAIRALLAKHAFTK